MLTQIVLYSLTPLTLWHKLEYKFHVGNVSAARP